MFNITSGLPFVMLVTLSADSPASAGVASAPVHTYIRLFTTLKEADDATIEAPPQYSGAPAFDFVTSGRL